MENEKIPQCAHPAGATIPSGTGWKCLDCGKESASFSADRIAALEAENARLHESENADIVHYKRLWIDARTRAEAAEATIERVRALPEKWRAQPRHFPGFGPNLRYDGNGACADELESALAGGEGGK